MRHAVLAVIILTGIAGCVRISTAPTLPSSAQPGLYQAQQSDEPYRLWAEATIFIDAAHDGVEIVPRREGRFHLNALKFLESYCTDCLKVTNIKKNGDSTIDLTVQITHPFKGYPEYTGFDVKGIIMFNGSYQFPQDSDKWYLPKPYFLISWRELGDPEVLDPDGYTPRWSPSWDSGSDLPIFNYWPGKYANGLPTAHLNAFLDFYSDEERHMFKTGTHVTRTYRIWLPASKPVVAGYAVEACWEPPLKMPVTDPANDFPITANQPEAYRFRIVVNSGETITDCEECCDNICSELSADIFQWGEFTSNRIQRCPPDGIWDEPLLQDCSPIQENTFTFVGMDSCAYGNGIHRWIAYNFAVKGPKPSNIAYDIFDFTVNDPDQ
jgi:hypothetical protein